MKVWTKIIRSNFFIKLTHWEYWPFGILQFPLFLYYPWLAVRARSLTFFTASNPGIAMGGMFGESKYDVIKLIPDQYVPVTVLITRPINVEQIVSLLKLHSLTLPVIFKPEYGERGYMVKRIYTEADIQVYIEQFPYTFLIQQLVDLPLEFGVFYTRYPKEKKGEVTSVVMKEMLTVTGDGTASLKELILAKDRAKLQWKKLQIVYNHKLQSVPEKGEVIELVSIGNHCLGTKFLDGSYLINEKLSDTFDLISKQIEGFYFGRYDLRCASLKDLYEGNIQILELNGCGAEPAHIYQPGFPLFKAIKVLLVHWKNIYRIAQENKLAGYRYLSLAEARAYYKKFKTLVT